MKILNPINIFNDFKSGKIDSASAIEKLLVNLQKTDDHTKKIQYINIFTEIYRDFMNKNKEFEQKLLNIIKNVIQNENYVYILNHIVDATKQINETLLSVVSDEIIKKYVLFYDIVPEEAKFIVDLDYLDPSYSFTRKKIQFAKRYKDRIVAHSKKEFFHDDRYYLIKQNHIIGLKFAKKIDKIPESIQTLKNLKYLHIYTGRRKFTLPTFMEMLLKLKYLKIYSKYQLEIPKQVRERVQQNFAKTYLQDGVCPDDAIILAGMEIFGWSLRNLEKCEIFEEDPKWYKLADYDVWDYRLDENGCVIEIYIRPWEGRPSLGFFLKEFCYFKKLEILELQFYQLKSIPEAITNLKHLTKLHITNYGKELTKIPESLKSFIDSLESFSFYGKYIYQ